MITGNDIRNKDARAETLRRTFNLRSLKTKALTLLIEHGPCCIFSLVAGAVGLPFLNHNPALEMGFALGGAVVGEYIGHRLFHKHEGGQSHMPTWKRYGLSLMFGVASWGAHQILLHDHAAHAASPHEMHSHEDADQKPAHFGPKEWKARKDTLAH